MNLQYRQPSLPGRIKAVAPEYLLLLAIFGSSKTQSQIRTELDRRATARPKHRPPARRSAA